MDRCSVVLKSLGVIEPALSPISQLATSSIYPEKFNDGAIIHVNANRRYSVLQPFLANITDRACVVINFGDSPEFAKGEFEGINGKVTYTAPLQAECKVHLLEESTVPPRQFAVVVNL